METEYGEEVEDMTSIRTVRAEVLISFPYSHEAWQSPRILPRGEVLEIRTDMHEGLVKGGYIKVVPPAVPLTALTVPEPDQVIPAPVDGDGDPRDAVIIPTHWSDLPWPDQRALAAKVKAPDRKIITKDDVVDSIRAEVARRAARPAVGLAPMVAGTAA